MALTTGQARFRSLLVGPLHYCQGVPGPTDRPTDKLKEIPDNGVQGPQEAEKKGETNGEIS